MSTALCTLDKLVQLCVGKKKMLPKIKSFALEQTFTPGPFGFLVNPVFILRRRLLQTIQRLAPNITGNVLDFGCGTKPYRKLFAHCPDYLGLDYAPSLDAKNNPHVDVFYDGKHIPFDDQHFDSIVAFEVMEHVFELEATLKELNRVLKPSGHFLLTAPFAWDEHSQPYDFARYTSFAWPHLLAKHGFEVVEQRKTTTYVEAVGQLAIACIWQTMLPQRGPIKWIVHLLVLMPMTLLTLVLSFILPKSQQFYCNNAVLARKTA
jgi:SAM-dependent methyltransferase